MVGTQAALVAEYIRHYTRADAIVFDPFCGSGVTNIESVRLGRKTIGVDLNPVATYITEMTLKNVDMESLEMAYKTIEAEMGQFVSDLYSTRCEQGHKNAIILATIWNRDGNKPEELRYSCKACGRKYRRQPTSDDLARLTEIEGIEVPSWYPRDRLSYNGREFKEGTHLASYNTVASLFTKRALISLSSIYKAILTLDVSQDVRDLLKFAFVSRTHLASRMTPVAKPSPRSHWTEDSTTSFWAQHRFWVPPKYMESNVWMLFESGIRGPQGLLRGKEESNSELRDAKEAPSFNALANTDANYLLLNASALQLPQIPDNSVDYCFTDPPYGGSIQYYELSTLWLSWLRGPSSDPRFVMDFRDEITINEQQRKDFDYYHKMLKAAFEEVYRVLKPGGYLTVTFHNTDIKVYNSIQKSIILAGFDLEKVIYQPPARASAKGLLQPYGSAVGDYYIRPHKPIASRRQASPAVIDKARYRRIVLGAVEKIIAERGEPTPYSIIINSYPVIYEELKKSGYLLTAPEGVDGVLREALDKELVLVPVTDDQGKTIGKKWWFKDPSRIPYLQQVPLRERVEVAVVNVLNRMVTASFDDILREIFIKFPNSLTPDRESVREIVSEYAERTKDKKWRLKPRVQVRGTQHDAMIELLCNLGEKARFKVYGDIPGRRDIDISGIPKRSLQRVKEIDVLWYRNAKIEYAFEVENTTGITEAIIRGANIPYPVRRFIVIPDERENLLSRRVEEPALKERILSDSWGFLRYDDILAFSDRAKHKSHVEPSEIEALSKPPKFRKIGTSRIDDFGQG